MTDELQTFIHLWNYEAKKTADMLRTLPAGQYDFRPDTEARSLGELAWHLAEVDAYPTWGIEQGGFEPGARPQGIERPRSIEALAPATNAFTPKRWNASGVSFLPTSIERFAGSVAGKCASANSSGELFSFI